MSPHDLSPHVPGCPASRHPELYGCFCGSADEQTLDLYARHAREFTLRELGLLCIAIGRRVAELSRELGLVGSAIEQCGRAIVEHSRRRLRYTIPDSTGRDGWQTIRLTSPSDSSVVRDRRIEQREAFEPGENLK
jgi:hypothetical protein